jgi:hypothetical protein
VNRSQQDINLNKDMRDARESEAEFFRSHPAYRNIAHKNGTEYLAKTLNQVRGPSYNMCLMRGSSIYRITGSYEPYPRKAAGYEGSVEYAHGTGAAGA